MEEIYCLYTEAWGAIFFFFVEFEADDLKTRIFIGSVT